MDEFKRDVEMVFDKCVENILWYAQEYNLDPQEMKKVFVEYANDWFDTFTKDMEEEEKELLQMTEEM